MKPAVALLIKLNVSANCVCVWMNGDVAFGPGGAVLASFNEVQENAQKFLKACCKVPEVVLSLGWISTELGTEYSKKHVEDMVELVLTPYLRTSGG